MATIWQDGIEGGYHDTRCQCPDHCLNCFDDLPGVRALRARLCAQDTPGFTEADQLGPRERYCSAYCRGRAKRERALDRRIAQHVPQEKT